MRSIISGCAALVLLFSLAHACDDVDTQLCIDLGKQYSGLCNDTCLSSICPRSCGLCPAKCFECHEINAPKNCSNLVQCPSMDHYCFTTQSFADDFREIYKLGCATKTLCKQYFGDRVGRGLRVDATCCATDSCNNMTPEAIENAKYHQTEVLTTAHIDVSVPNLMEACDNIDDVICSKLLKVMPGVCHNDTCIVSKLCPRMCEKCFRCYSCNDIDKISDCSSVATCVPGKQCFSLETLSIDLRPVYRLGCLDVKLCDRFRASPPNPFGKRQDLQLKGGCCHTDMCNHAIHFTTKPPPTTTTTAQQTTTPACPTRHHLGSCPAGWLDYHHICYHIGAHTMTWSDAKKYCQEKCGQLAAFTIARDFESALRHLNIDTTGETLWSDAVIHRQSWTWSTSGSTVDSSLIHTTSFKFPLPMYCGRISVLNARLHRVYLSEMSCTNKYKPLCEIL